MADGKTLWERYCRYHYSDSGLGFSLDISRVRFEESDLEAMADSATRAIEAIKALEGGAIANADENRMVGHYWLRDPDLAPTAQLAAEIREDVDAVRAFAAKVHSGEVKGPNGPFRRVLHIGIGGSALGPQFIAQALSSGPNDRLKFHFFDNTDPEGMDAVFAEIGDDLDKTLITVVSKSGGTPEPANGMLEAKAACRRRGLDFAKQAIAVTMPGSKLDKIADGEGWLARFRMADWVGGRTSLWCPVGLVPAALQGIDIQGLLEGAAAMDKLGREPDFRKNPAALIALMWHKVGGGKGAKDMVILPYKDRLLLLSRYLQQLVMESLGKELDRKGAKVHQGIAVYGNKGSTDQHAYVQQLRDGVPNFFATFIQVLTDRNGASIEVEPGVTSGDYLFGFLQGTRRALFENERDSITITVNETSSRSVGALIALFERAVGIYAELVDINAYHQPGVEAGKKAAAAVLALQHAVVAQIQADGSAQTAQRIADAIGQSDEVETVYKILEHLAANQGKGVLMSMGDAPDAATFQKA